MIYDEYTSESLDRMYYLTDRHLQYGKPVGHSATPSIGKRVKYRDANWMP